MTELPKILAAMIAAALALAAQITDAATCPPQGDSPQARLQALDRLKNRTPFAVKADPTITLERIAAPGDDTKRWSTDQAASVTGYVAVVKPGGRETANCHRADRLDTHIALVVDPKTAGDSKTHVIVEVTPSGRDAAAKRGEDWSTAALRKRILGKRVTVSGLIFYDVEHAASSVNTAKDPKAASVWRATDVEIHPVVSIQVLDHNP